MSQKAVDLEQPIDYLIAGNKTAIRGYDHGHNAEAASTERDDVISRSGMVLTSTAIIFQPGEM